jgi:hypothetical protein
LVRQPLLPGQATIAEGLHQQMQPAPNVAFIAGNSLALV